MRFVNRKRELEALEAWWKEAGPRLGLVWGRRRVGKTLLLQEFAKGRSRTIYHTFAGRPMEDELRMLANIFNTIDSTYRPRWQNWDDALESLVHNASEEPLLLILDEFQLGATVSPELPSVLRALWDRIQGHSQLRVLLCGSAIQTMEEMQNSRAPLYGRFELSLLIHPFEPHEAALMLTHLPPEERALVWGVVGGVPLYLNWWNQSDDLRNNLLRLVCTPGGRLLNEGELALRGETFADLERQILFAIGAGRTRHNEIKDAVRAEPTRQLERLIDLRLVERLEPVTEEGTHTRRRIYRIADNFLAFWIACIEPFRTQIERGLGATIIDALIMSIDDHLGPRWEEAFRAHLRRLALSGKLGAGVVAVGPFWTHRTPDRSHPGLPLSTEIDAVVLAGRERQPVLIGEAKWARSVDAGRIVSELERKSAMIPGDHQGMRLAVCARSELRNLPEGVFGITAADIFA
ncbi:MAG: ATP-binding protein [Candidatus Dormibacteraceae bacterium]